MSTQSTPKENWINTLRVLATVAVIIVHTSAPVVLKFNNPPDLNWWIGNIYGSLARFCVPVFVMLTGALLLPKETDLKTFFVKRFKRVLIPFLFWSCIYILIYFLSNIDQTKTYNFRTILIIISSKLFHGASYHFWYIYMLIGLYLFIPILGKWIRNATENEILYFLIVWVASLIISRFPYFDNLTPIYFTKYIGYLVLGYYLSVKTFNSRFVTPPGFLFIYLFGSVITAAGTYFLSGKEGKYNAVFFDFLTINVLISTIGIFEYVRYFSAKSGGKILQIFNLIGKHSYGIYLVHVFVLSFLEWSGVDAYLINPIIGIPLTMFACLFISTSIVIIVNKLPFGKYVAG